MSLLTTSNLAFCAARRVFRGCDLIHARLSPSDVGALLTARDLKVPLVVQVEAAPPAQGAESPTALVEGSERLAGVALSQSLQDADAIVTVSAPLRDLLIADWGVKPERVTVLRSGVDAPGPLSSDRIAQLRREYQLGAGPILFLAGDRETWHGVDLFLEALVRVRATYPEVMLLVASEAPVPGEILERVASLEVASSVRVLGGVEPEQLSHFVAVADIALVPPAAPPFELPSSQTIIEYMAAGKAIVASRSEQVAELLTGDMAILVEPASRDLARAMERLLGDDDLRMGLGARARCEAEREQSWALYVRRLAAVYESVRVE
jgi:glycosyltransferase involved in cell wall biosynthesis